MGTILIVDDEPNVRQGLQAYLEDEGFTVHTAGSAEEAIEIVERVPEIKLVIMDMRLPHIDGAEGIRRLNHLVPNLQFIVHTGSQAFSPPDDLRAIGVTQEHVFRKPVVDMGTIATAIRKFLKGSLDGG